MMSKRRAFQGGPQTLWTALETTALAWLNNDRPGLGRYGLTVTLDLNTVWLDEPGNPVGALSLL
ncbi:hypothetical protein [Streptomyces sp. NPDC086182]|jgi:hypothetical protein|uniref:hypothetical protein n=1 Tax=Streptomyces sp. NPDC086182 TaxID=3155058 RepID=UPI003422C735